MLPLYSVSRYSFSGSLESKAKPVPFKLPKQLTTDFCCVLILSSYQFHLLNTGAFTLLTLHPGRLRAPHLLLLQCLYFDVTFSQSFLYSPSQLHYSSSHLSLSCLFFITSPFDIHIFLQVENTVSFKVKLLVSPSAF